MGQYLDVFNAATGNTAISREYGRFHSATMTLADVMMLCYWNIVYHLGQINQIQLMLGDEEMH